MLSQQCRQRFLEAYSRAPRYLFETPGRTELGGNHTDHQNGRVLSAAVELCICAAVSENGAQRISVCSDGYPPVTIDLGDLSAKPEEKGTTAALVRGVAAAFSVRGYRLCGFDAFVLSEVLPGSGLSSSAAFEVLIATVIDHLSGAGLAPIELAKIAQYAENVYFGKPCGLMDQVTCAVGACLAIDFIDTEAPSVCRLDYDFTKCGHRLCIVHCGTDHADLTEAYAAIPAEMRAVAQCFGKTTLGDVDETSFCGRVPELRQIVGDRAVLRAMHFFAENRRVEAQKHALQNGEFSAFLHLMHASGISSWTLLQNIVPQGNTEQQALALALALAQQTLGERGACRVHGGGFAGTIQAFVPDDLLERFCRSMELVFGAGACRILSVRHCGSRLVEHCG